MPRLRPAHVDMPLGANRVHRAIATTSRVELIRALLANPYSTAPEVRDATGLSREAVREALEQLERLGYLHVSVEIPAGRRRGHVPSYALHTHLLLPDLDTLTTYIRHTNTDALVAGKTGERAP
ncbi:winged helix-turn-helix transcriptional regulator [Microbacterium maritypicum]|uniref:winged helix-turn-helix transcriptional regulator n=1 Tax=Microbacterium maritypicum TaxID=33918 RepID=UPI0037FABF2F